MMKELIVTVNCVQTDISGDKNTIELSTVGKSYIKNNATIIRYQESALTGMENTTTVIKVYANEVILVRMGEFEYKQEFCIGQTSYGLYVTPYGTMKMHNYTSNLEINLYDSLGTINIEYDLFIEGKYQSTNYLTITTREDKQNGC